MNIGAVAIIILVTFVLCIAFSFFLVRWYVNSKDATYLTTGVSIMAITITLFCVLLIPVDIYTVSSNLNEDGTHSDLDTISNTQTAIQWVYYLFYSLLIIWAFIVLPFAYFYFEEEDESGAIMPRVWGALKYTAGFFFTFIILLVIGIIIWTSTRSNDDSSTDWQQRLRNDFGAGDAIFAFTIGTLGCIGLIAYVPYAAYGIARVPIRLMSKGVSAKADEDDEKLSNSLNRPLTNRRDRSNDSVSDGDLAMKIKRNEENIQYLSSQYEHSGKAYTKEDKKRMMELRQEARRLSTLRAGRDAKVESKSNGGGAANIGTGAASRLVNIWNTLAPLRITVGILLLLLSLLIIVALCMTAYDRISNSTCGPACGYAVNDAGLINPIDAALTVLSPYFPIDAIFFGILVMYIYLTSLLAIVAIGVRLFIWKLYSVYKGRTEPHAMVMGCFWLMFIALVINMEILTLAPQYATFGNQFYITQAPNGTAGNSTHSSSTAIFVNVSSSSSESAADSISSSSTALDVSSSGSSSGSSSSSSSSNGTDPPSSWERKLLAAPLTTKLTQLEAAIVHAVATTPRTFYLHQTANDSSSSSSAAGDILHSSSVAHNGSEPFVGEKESCTLAFSAIASKQGTDQCLMTKVGTFLLVMGVEFPFFSVILFYANLLFVLFFLFFFVYGLFKTREVFGAERYKAMEDGNESD